MCVQSQGFSQQLCWPTVDKQKFFSSRIHAKTVATRKLWKMFDKNRKRNVLPLNHPWTKPIFQIKKTIDRKHQTWPRFFCQFSGKVFLAHNCVNVEFSSRKSSVPKQYKNSKFSFKQTHTELHTLRKLFYHHKSLRWSKTWSRCEGSIFVARAKAHLICCQNVPKPIKPGLFECFLRGFLKMRWRRNENKNNIF